jgi:hypothetical protein
LIAHSSLHSQPQRPSQKYRYRSVLQLEDARATPALASVADWPKERIGSSGAREAAGALMPRRLRFAASCAGLSDNHRAALQLYTCQLAQTVASPKINQLSALVSAGSPEKQSPFCGWRRLRGAWVLLLHLQTSGTTLTNVTTWTKDLMPDFDGSNLDVHLYSRKVRY